MSLHPLDAAFKKIPTDIKDALADQFNKEVPRSLQHVYKVIVASQHASNEKYKETYASMEGDMATRITLSLEEVQAILVHLENFLNFTDLYRVHRHSCNSTCMCIVRLLSFCVGVQREFLEDRLKQWSIRDAEMQASQMGPLKFHSAEQPGTSTI